MKNYTFEQIRKANTADKSDRTDCATPADVYITRKINGCVRKGDKQKAVEYLIKLGLLK